MVLSQICPPDKFFDIVQEVVVKNEHLCPKE